MDLNDVADADLLAQYAQETEDGKFILNRDQPRLAALMLDGANPFILREQALKLIKLHLFFGLGPSLIVSTDLFVAMADRIKALEEKAWIRDQP